jgi:hypothetical protein
MKSVVALRRARLLSAEIEVSRHRGDVERAKTHHKVAVATFDTLQKSIFHRMEQLEVMRAAGEGTMAVLKRYEDYLRGQRMLLAQQEIVVGRARGALEQCEAEFDKAIKLMWRCRQQLDHSVTLHKTAFRKRVGRQERLAEEGASPHAPTSPRGSRH